MQGRRCCCGQRAGATFLSIRSLAPAHLDSTVEGAMASSGRPASAASFSISVVLPVPAELRRRLSAPSGWLLAGKLFSRV